MVRRPDVEAAVWAAIRHLPNVTSFCFAQESPLPRWVTVAGIQVDARAPRRQLALDRAENARLALEQLPGQDWPGGVIAFVAVTEGPFWNPDDDGEPRYTTRYEVRVHPRRDAVPAAGSGAGAGRPAVSGRKRE